MRQKFYLDNSQIGELTPAIVRDQYLHDWEEIIKEVKDSISIMDTYDPVEDLMKRGFTKEEAQDRIDRFNKDAENKKKK